VQFFAELAKVRHSVIHADSLPRWTYNKKTRRVADHYAHGDWRVEVSEEQLTEAIEATIKQVKWYDEKLQAIGK